MALIDRLVGQETVVAWIDDAVARPVHAYLIVGGRGSGLESAARMLAGRLLDADERSWRLIESGHHPDVREFRPDGASYKVEDVRERINVEAIRAPIEGDRKVLIVHETERMCSIPNAANAFLKTLEEPPPRTIIVLLTSSPDDVLPTMRSRCSRIDLAPIGETAIVQHLVGANPGVDLAAIERAGALSGGQLGRAERLLGEVGDVRLAFAAIPARLDGVGARAATIASELDATIGAVVERIEARHATELAEFDVRMEREGYDTRGARRQRKPIEDQHKRELRRARIDLLVEGVAAIESVLFDAMSGTKPRNDDVDLPAWSPRRCAEGIEACRRARAALTINEKGLLHLEHLLLLLSPFPDNL